MRFGKKQFLKGVLCISLIVSGLAFADGLQDENLLEALPKGYKVVSSFRKGDIAINEMVPKSETLKNWDEKLTTQIFFNHILGEASPKDIFHASVDQWKDSCTDVRYGVKSTKAENNCPTFVGYLFCFDKGKQKFEWYKSIKGNDSDYVVEWATKKYPVNSLRMKWLNFISSVHVCDSRDPKRHPCPTVHSSRLK